MTISATTEPASAAPSDQGGMAFTFSARLSPEHSAAVDVDYRLVDIVLGPVVVHRFLAPCHRTVVIDHAEAADGQFRIERLESLDSGLVEIAVQTQQRYLRRRQVGQ